MCVCVCVCVCVCERERERQTETDRDKETETGRQKQTDRERDSTCYNSAGILQIMHVTNVLAKAFLLSYATLLVLLYYNYNSLRGGTGGIAIMHAMTV